MGLHRRAKLTVTGRELLVRRIVDEGWPACWAAKMVGVSRATAYKWLARYRQEGLAGLEDRTSRPHRSPRRLSQKTEEHVLAVRRQQRWGPHRLSVVVRLPRSTVYAILVRHRCSRLSDSDAATGTVIRYVREHPGELVHIDIKKLGRVPSGGGHRVLRPDQSGWSSRGMGCDYLHVAVDDASRLAYVQALPTERGQAAAQFLRAAHRFFLSQGVEVERILTDQGVAYRSKVFEATAAELGLRHKRTRVRRPQTNGKAERFIQTLTREWAYARVYRANDDRLEQLPRWLYRYNARRPHTALGGLSPLDVVNNVLGNYS